MRRIVLLLLVALSGCTVAATASSQSPDTGTAATAAPSQAAPTTAAPVASSAPASDVPAPTDTPSDGPKTFGLGDVVTVTHDDSKWATIALSKASTHSSYGSGYLVDRPDKGNVYLQVWIAYAALTDGVDYNTYDWSVFVDGNAVDDFTFVYSGPKPTLSSGSLPKGRKASGWMIIEVPAKGEVRFSYSNNIFSDTGPVFEVVVRAH